ncbi:calcium-binding protein [Paracoccaceae bacterium Fryx2]|nr:calcium-binding protein [Paracoccaceae bacterium Fryx2]
MNVQDTFATAAWLQSEGAFTSREPAIPGSAPAPIGDADIFRQYVPLVTTLAEAGAAKGEPEAQEGRSDGTGWVSSTSLADATVADSLTAGSQTRLAAPAQTPVGTASGAAPAVAVATAAAGADGVIIVAPGTSAAQLQTLIDTAPAGTTLRLAAGHFSFDRTITVNRDDISVIGAGSDKTFIDVPPTLGQEAFHVGNGRTAGSFALAADMAEGGTAMTLTGAHSLAAGDFVFLSRESTEAFYDEIGDKAWRNTDVPLRTSIAQVESVNGSQITLASGVHFDFSTGETRVTEISMVENVTLGGFTVDYGLSTANPSAFSNTLGNYDRNAVIEIDGTAGLHLFDVTSRDVPSLGVNVASSTGVTAVGLTMTGAHNKGDSGNGYGLQIRDVYDSSFTDISDADMRHSVVFASWCSSAGNFVHVTQTDRDINFHGGRDHDNVVVVDRSVRDANSDIIGATLFVNVTGTHYGSVTDADANVVTFGHVVGTRLNDQITGYANGAWLDGMGGNDSLTGGAGNDLLIGGTGRDVLNGAGGEDIVRYSGRFADFTITSRGNGVFEVRDRVGTQSTDQVSQVEWLLFGDKAVHLADMSIHSVAAVNGIFAGAGTWLPAAPVLPELVGTSGKDVFEVTVAGTTVSGLGDFDTVRSTVDFTMSGDVERLDLVGSAAIDGTGSTGDNHMHGNDAGNVLQGLAGNDQLWGKDGDDVLLGGAGNDQITGDAGNDRIDGGAGQDKMKGGAGADVFVFALASDTERLKSDKVLDFQTGVDRIDLTGIDANVDVAGDQAFVRGTANAGAGSVWVKSGYVYGDTNGDGVADLAIYVTGTVGQHDILL